MLIVSNSRRAMAFGKLFSVGSVDHRHVTKNWRHLPERPVDGDLLGGIRDVVVAPQHVGDVHVDVVDDYCEVVEGRAIRPQNHKIANILTFETDASVHRILPGQLAGGNAQPDRVFLHVRLALFEQLIGDLLVPGHAGALENRSLVPVEAEPGEAVEDDLGVFVGGTGLVGVLDAEQERAALFAGEEPVEEGGAGAADVEVSGGRRGEANTGAHRGGGS